MIQKEKMLNFTLVIRGNEKTIFFTKYIGKNCNIHF